MKLIEIKLNRNRFTMKVALVGALLIAFAAQARADQPAVSEAVLEKIRAASERPVKAEDVVLGLLDADNVQDAAVLHALDKNKAYHLIILKGGTDGSFRKVFDKPAARCLDCLGIKGRPPGLKISKRRVIVDEMGGSRWAWYHKYYYKFTGTQFGLTRVAPQTFDTLTGDVVRRDIYLNSGLERREISYGRRSEYKSMRKRKYRLNANHVVSSSADGEIKLDGLAGEAAWSRAKAVRVTSGSLIYYGRGYRRGTTDLSFNIKSIQDERFVYFFLDVRDSRRYFGRSATVGTDHVELWFSSATPGDDTVMMKPKFDAKNTMQIGLVPMRGSSRVIARRWYPTNRPAIGVEARYRKTRRGWSMEVRMERNQILRGGASLVNFTAAVSDADTRRAGRRKTLMGTSRLSRRAPGFLGVLVVASIMNQGFLTGLNGD